MLETEKQFTATEAPYKLYSLLTLSMLRTRYNTLKYVILLCRSISSKYDIIIGGQKHFQITTCNVPQSDHKERISSKQFKKNSILKLVMVTPFPIDHSQVPLPLEATQPR
jgi:hypothetical protein